ncbi:molecular chaperone [Rouxiella chamberiensis]|uniref:Fimbria/pilus periplasmic chaperone n=1 Tax=Rouxiella chamberiensis TaxID=1513468 RepID=A0ABY7HPY5_9GAMM|nr:fimbria/pilus periplasmic chaperone [Rouxiella chamberiensis]WAT01082.1 fimbria/pilus periplasmic chaperone [Rouxiella chamberiensis]
MVFSTLRSLARWAAMAAALTASASALAASSVLVWPVYQIIEADQNGSALWLENRGADPVTLQIRVYAWKQDNFNENYADQTNVVISPPFATVAPGDRQLIRLIRNTPAPTHTEQAYRIIIDEVPSSLNQPKETNKPMVGLQLQMRYLAAAVYRWRRIMDRRARRRKTRRRFRHETDSGLEPAKRRRQTLSASA